MRLFGLSMVFLRLFWDFFLASFLMASSLDTGPSRYSLESSESPLYGP